MGQKLAPDRNRATIAISAAIITLMWQTTIIQVLIIVIAGVIGLLLYKSDKITDLPNIRVPISRNVGILTAALYDPIWTSSILAPIDFALASILFGMLVFWKLPPWIVVLTGALGGTLIC